jgi:hypothetical protein
VPGAADAQEGIANPIPLIMMGTVALQDLDELAALGSWIGGFLSITALDRVSPLRRE